MAQCRVCTVKNESVQTPTDYWFESRPVMFLYLNYFLFIIRWLTNQDDAATPRLSTQWNNGTIIHGYVNYLQFWRLMVDCAVAVLAVAWNFQSMNDRSLSFAFNVGPVSQWSLHSGLTGYNKTISPSWSPYQLNLQWTASQVYVLLNTQLYNTSQLSL